MISNKLWMALVGIAAIQMALSTAPAFSQGGSQFADAKIVAFATGKCSYRLNHGPLTSCHHSVMFVTLKSGRSYFLFTKEDASFSFSGGSDRQPNLENYHLALDKASFGRGGRGAEGPVEGECRVRMTREGKFRHVQCDAYNRANGLSFSFTLANISSMEHRNF